MVKTALKTILIFSISPLFLIAGNIFHPKAEAVNQQSIPQERPFINGEILTFIIRYGIIQAGTAVMKISTSMYNNSNKVYHIQTTAVSASGFSWIYKVDDVVNSYVDYDKFYPIRFEKKLREGGYKADLFTDYFPGDSMAKVETIRYTTDMKVKKKSVYDISVPPFSQDVLSSFYYIRTQSLQVGKSIFLTNHEKKKVYDMEVKVLKKETIKVEAGTFRCIVVEPIVLGEGLFKNKGRLLVWLTDDEYKIPVQMKSEVIIGDITTELTKINGIDVKIPARVN